MKKCHKTIFPNLLEYICAVIDFEVPLCDQNIFDVKRSVLIGQNISSSKSYKQTTDLYYYLQKCKIIHGFASIFCCDLFDFYFLSFWISLINIQLLTHGGAKKVHIS